MALEKHNEKPSKNALGENVYLTNEVFEQLWGTDYSNPRIAKEVDRMDFSGPGYALETLVGPEQGLMGDRVKNCRYNVQILNIGRNQLTDISCIDKKRITDGEPEFGRLSCLIASRNQLTQVTLKLDNLVELNLAHNELKTIPPTVGLPNLQTLILAHNKISDTLKALESNTRLRKLLLHDNLLSWKPTEFERQMKILASNHLYRLTIFPQPFAKVFTEYQFLAVTVIDTLVELDGYTIDADLRNELRGLEEQKRATNSLDYSIFDIKVQERMALKGAGEDGMQDYVDLGKIPTLDDMITRLNKPLDHPNQLIKYCYAFKEQITLLWGARYPDRRTQMTVSDASEAKEKVNEIVSKLQLLLGRFDTAQDVLVECLVRLCASGNQHLSEQCAVVLADWVDSLPPSVHAEDAGGLLSIAAPLFQELRIRLLPGMQSFNDNPEECMFVHKGRMNAKLQEKAANGFFGNNDAIAESAEILGALAKFGRSSFAQPSSSSRSAILCPLLPVLCRASREDMSKVPDGPSDAPQHFIGFGFFHGANATEPITVTPEGFESVCYGRCKKHNYGGFEVKASATAPGLLDATFSKDSPDALRGMRLPCEGATLFTMPCRHAPKEGLEASETSEILTWDVWRNGLDVLVVATAEPRNARICVLKFNLHETLLKHEAEVFTEDLLNVAVEAGIAFTSLLHLAVNLLNCGPKTSAIVRHAFQTKKLHVRCWKLLRRRLTEGGGAVARARLKQATEEFTKLVSALVRIIFEMSQQAKVPNRHGCPIMADLADGMEDLFNMMLDIAADTDVPDPLLLSASLQTLHLFLACEKTRVKSIGESTVVSLVLQRLHLIQTLLPYIRGPRLNDNNNNKYQDLWQLCEIKYTKDAYGEKRLPQLYDPAQRETGEWREKCPELKDLRNPLMHRVLLDIVKLIELFSSQAEHDTSNEFRNVTDMLDKNDREKILIGPSTGLVLVPDYDVKLGVLKVIQHVLETAPGQFQTQEMGWLLRYLQSTKIGIGRQEEFLGEVLILIKILIQNLQDTGFQFRQQFAKQAIRQAFEMLKANTARDLNGAIDEEESKIALSLEIVNMLRVCSKPLSGGLRPFLRRVDFMQILKNVMIAEDGERQSGIREPLLRTWTGRDMREVLLPLVTMNMLKVLGVGRYRSLVRLADVLQGRSDFDLQVSMVDRGGYIGRRSTDEAKMWDGLYTMKSLLQIADDLFMADCELQQNEFISQNAIDGCLQYVEKIFTSNEKYQTINAEARTWINKEFVLYASNKVMDMWKDVAAKIGQKDKKEVVKHGKEGPTLVDFIVARLTSINDHLGEMYRGISVSVFVESSKQNSLNELADKVKWYVEECRKDISADKRKPDYQILEKIENCYADPDGKLRTKKEMKDQNIKYAKCRQLVTTIEDLEKRGKVAQVTLKRLLMSRNNPDPNTLKWAEWAMDTDSPDIDEERRSSSEGLVDFLQKYDATVYDPGLRPIAEIKRAMIYKYRSATDTHDIQTGDVTRVRNRARVIIAFDDPRKLFSCVTDMKENPRFSVLLVRNRFAKSTSLGERYIRLYVEVQVYSQRFICEISMVLSPSSEPAKLFDRETKMKSELKTCLRDTCKVEQRLDDVTDCIFFELSSRAIRHLDLVYIEQQWTATQSRSLMVRDKKVTLTKDPKTQRNLFTIERRDGFGPIKTGDAVRFRNFLTKRFLDASMVNFGIRCQYLDADDQSSNMLFVIEAAQEMEFSPMDLDGDLEDTKVAKEKKKKKKIVAQLPDILTHGTNFSLKIDESLNPVRFLTSLPTRWGGSDSILKAEQKWSPKKPQNLPFQTFTIYREGSLRAFLQAENLETVEKAMKGKLYSMEQTKDQQQADNLQFAYMAPFLQTQAPLEGGMFRRGPPEFRDIAVRKDTEPVKRVGDADEEGVTKPALEGREKQVVVTTLPTLAVASLCRCVYSLVEMPALMDARIFAIDDMLGIPEEILPDANSKLSRFLAVAITATIAPDRGRLTPDGTLIGVTEETDIETVLVGWVAAKFLKTFSALLRRMPALSLPASKRKEKLNEPDLGKSLYQEMERKGSYDKHRLCMLLTYSCYISRVLAQPVHQRLAVASQRPMDKAEVTLLVELCRSVSAIARAYYSNELRCLDPKTTEAVIKSEENAGITNVASGFAKQAAIENGTSRNAGSRAIANGNPSAGQSTELAVFDGDAPEEFGAFELFGKEEEEKEVACIRHALEGGLEAQMFANLVPRNVLTVLVHAFLHGMRMEVQAYEKQGNIANESEECVKLGSSLVQESLQALATCMQGCGAQSEDSSCDYDVLEAISHAMCAGPRFVPRARVTQLMNEWYLERHRKSVQSKMEEPDLEDMYSQALHPPLEPSERVHTIAFVWAVMFKDGSQTQFPELTRRLCVVTSRQNFILLTLPQRADDEGVTIPEADDMEVEMFRCLSRVQSVVIHPRIQAFVGLKWDTGSPSSCYQALFFENYYRRKEFIEVLRLVTRFRPIKQARNDPEAAEPEKYEVGPKKGIKFELARKNMMLYLRKSCKLKSEPRAEAHLVNVSLVRDEGCANAMKVLVMTREAVNLIEIGFILRYWCASEQADDSNEISAPHDLEDSDEDRDGIPKKMPGEPQEIDDIGKLPGCEVDEPKTFKKLTGVWFLAEPDPKVNLQFQGQSVPMSLRFFSEGDRQRFRQHLAGALKLDNEGQGEEDIQAQREQGRAWRVKATVQRDVSNVQKEVREVEKYVEEHLLRKRDFTDAKTPEQ